jgi:methyltransferase (TIGR00027 family)
MAIIKESINDPIIYLTILIEALMTYSNRDKMSVEYRPSETAMGTATLRALAAMDERKEIKGPDYLAELFLPDEHKSPLKDPAIREWVMKNRIAPGMYEFMIARTAFFDHVVEQALLENIPQIVFLGAGYDSRSYRFNDMIKDTRIFELDIQPTQKHKKTLLYQASINIPDHLVFVSINFKTDHIGDILNQVGFNRNQKTLFVWEGVTYYLSATVIDDTLSVITSNSPAGSLICFDYASHSPDRLNDDGLKKIREMMRSNYPDEPTQFGIKDGEIKSFLSSRGYNIIEHINSTEMERKYLSLADGSSAGKVPASFCLILASVSDHSRYHP